MLKSSLQGPTSSAKTQKHRVLNIAPPFPSPSSRRNKQLKEKYIVRGESAETPERSVRHAVKEREREVNTSAKVKCRRTARTLVCHATKKKRRKAPSITSGRPAAPDKQALR